MQQHPTPFLLIALAILPVSAAAQCLQPAPGGTPVTLTAGDGTWLNPLGFPASVVPVVPASDEGLSAPIPLGFNFPMSGAAAPTFSHVVVESNGIAYLTNGGPVITPPHPEGNFGGVSGSSPRIAAFWADLENLVGGSNWSVSVDTSVPGTCTIDWRNVNFKNVWGSIFGPVSTPPQVSMQARLFANGNVAFSYSDGFTFRHSGPYGGIFATTGEAGIIGVSPGNGNLEYGIPPQGVFGPSDSFPFLNTTTTSNSWVAGALAPPYAPPTADLPFLLQGRTLLLTYTGQGYSDTITCSGAPLAAHTSYGKGCYDEPGEVVYQLFPDAAAASLGLQGNALLITPVGYGYVGAWVNGGASGYIPPSAAATTLVLADNDDVVVALPQALPSPKGPVNQVTVSSNGIVTLGPVGNAPGQPWPNTFQFPVQPVSFPFSPPGATSPAGLSNLHNGTAFYAWHDYNPADGGAVKTELVNNVFVITFQNVENPPVVLTNPGTVQFQLDLVSGGCTMLWTVVDTNTAGSGLGAFGVPETAHLVGWKTGGVVADNGSVNLAGSPAIFTRENLLPPALAASPRAISTPTAGSTVTYSATNVPEFIPGSGVRLAVNVFSLNPLPAPGVDLAVIGAPGCRALVASLDVLQNISAGSINLVIPPGIPAGSRFYSQVVSLVPPGSLPNGQNAFGLTLSNGLETLISPY